MIDSEHEPQTAMLLTQTEWDLLAAMVAHYIVCTDWIHTTAREDVPPEILAKRDLANRIIDANA